MTDQELIKGCLDNKREYQQLLYRQYSSKLMGICVRYASNVDEAKDFLQEGFIQIFTKLETFKHLGSFEGWMRRIVVNTCLSHLRKQSQYLQVLEEDQIEIEADSTEDYLNTKDLLKFIQQLPAGFRQVFNLYAIEGYSHREIGEMLSISEGTSKSQFSRAKKSLQKLINKEELIWKVKTRN